MQFMLTIDVSSSCTLFASAVELRKGPKVDLTKSRVLDPKSIPVDSTSRKLPQTMWRVDRLRDMTYTQFWHLIQERQIARVSDSPLRIRAARCICAAHLCFCTNSLTLACIMSADIASAVGQLLCEEASAFCLILLLSASCTCCSCTAAVKPLRQVRS